MSTSGYEVAIEVLKKNKSATYGDVLAAAKKRGATSLPPIVYGRAKLALGLTGGKRKSAGGRRGRKPGRKPGRPAGSGRKPGRPAGAGGRDPLAGLVAKLRRIDRLERALGDIRRVLASV